MASKLSQERLGAGQLTTLVAWQACQQLLHAAGNQRHVRGVAAQAGAGEGSRWGRGTVRLRLRAGKGWGGSGRTTTAAQQAGARAPGKAARRACCRAAGGRGRGGMRRAAGCLLRQRRCRQQQRAERAQQARIACHLRSASAVQRGGALIARQHGAQDGRADGGRAGSLPLEAAAVLGRPTAQYAQSRQPRLRLLLPWPLLID